MQSSVPGGPTTFTNNPCVSYRVVNNVMLKMVNLEVFYLVCLILKLQYLLMGMLFSVLITLYLLCPLQTFGKHRL